MFITKIILSVILSLNSFFTPILEYFERGIELAERLGVSVSAGVSDSSVVVIEANTMHTIKEQNPEEVMPARHFAKLMTLLVTCEAVENGEIALDTITTVSKNANAMQGTQIWLDIGEKISVEELIKAITIGNANDACVALSEAVSSTEANFVELMNVKAKQLGMESTYFADCTGISDATITTAKDVAILTAELSKREWIYPYTTTWLDNVRSNKTELVNNNRLVRTYDGIIGFKAFGDDEQNFLSAAAKRNDMTVVCVVMNEKDKDYMFTSTRDNMNKAFAAYEIFVPKYEKEVLDDISVNCGEKLNCKVRAKDNVCVLIPKGRGEDVEVEFDRVSIVPSPVKKGTIVGSVSLRLDDETIFSTDIVTDENIAELTLLEAYRRLLLELLNI